MKGIIEVSDLPTFLSVEELLEIKGGDGPVIHCNVKGSGVCMVEGSGICSAQGDGFVCSAKDSGIIEPVPDDPIPYPDPIYPKV